MKKQIPRCPCGSVIDFLVTLATIAVCLYVPIVILVNYQNVEFAIILGSVTAVVLLGGRWLYYKLRRHHEERCAENDCRCACHYIKACKCKCHEYCDAHRAIEEKRVLESELWEKKNHCEECRWDQDIPGWPCECLCHSKVTTAVKQRSGNSYCSCRCHKWCYR